MRSSRRPKPSPGNERHGGDRDDDGDLLVSTPASRLVQALARHQAWLDLKQSKNAKVQIDPSLLT